ncbi:MAG: DNA polymerase III subunit delta [Deltaproteobacteria bacterium]|nr:DNA polymerase III subunit delta [Deltaproteobacteria bacterium]
MSHPIIERHLERKAVRPLYLFYGDEEFLMERALARLEEGLKDQWGEAPVRVQREAPVRVMRKAQEEALPEAQEKALPEFLAESREASLWGPGQLLVLRRLALNAAALKAINDYLDHPAPRAWVVLLAEGVKARDWAKHPVWSRLSREEAAVGFYRLKEAELFQWLTQEARSLGKTLTLAAAQRLVEIVGDNLAELSQELEKLALYAGEEKSLTPSLVNQLTTHSRTYNIFALLDALGEPGPQKRLTALGDLLDLGEKEPKILATLAGHLRKLIRLKEGGGGLNLTQWHQRKVAEQAKRFSAASLRAHLFLLHHVDLQLKTSAGSPRLWLEWALLKMGPG